MTAGPAPVPAAGHRRTPRVLAVLADLRAVVAGALEPAHLGVWITEGER
jgi:hypothetical protein